MSCSTDLMGSFSIECNPDFKNFDQYFIGSKYYKNHKYYGDIVSIDDNEVKVECKNGNKYMNGQIITLHINNN